MKASIPSRHHPPQAAQKPLIWLEFSLVRVTTRGAAVVGVAAMGSGILLGKIPNPKPQTRNPKSHIPNPNYQPQRHRDSEDSFLFNQVEGGIVGRVKVGCCGP